MAVQAQPSRAATKRVIDVASHLHRHFAQPVVNVRAATPATLASARIHHFTRRHFLGRVLSLAQRPHILSAQVSSEAELPREDVGRASDGGEREEDDPPTWTAPLLLAILFVCQASFLFGFHSGVLNTPLKAIASDLVLSVGSQSAAVSAMVVGGMAGALGCAPLSDRFGRRTSLLSLVLPLATGTLLCAYASNTAMMVAGRLLCGLGAGASSVLAPSLLAELSPAKTRGVISLLTRLAYVVGMLVAFGTATCLQNIHGSLLGGAWRSIFLVPLLPVALLAGGILSGFVPESPTWLAQQGKSGEAAAVMSKIQAIAPSAAQAWVAVEQANMKIGSKGSAAWHDLALPEHRQSMFICTGLAILHALSGSNMVVFFAATVFAGAGLGNSAAIATVAVGIANLLGTFVAAVMTDRLGRRPLLIRSFSAMAACLTVLVASQLPQVANSSPLLAAGAAVACIPAFMVCFASGVGPVVYLLYSELFAARIRAKGVAFCGAVNWAGVLLLTTTFLPLYNCIGGSATFSIYAAIAAIGAVFAATYVPETKGRSLQEIEQQMAAKIA